MKKIIFPFAVIAALASCSKEQNLTATETSAQQLVKITKTEAFGGGLISIDYAYDNAGRLLKEGGKTYYRDDKERIIRIVEPGTSTNRTDIYVYYKDPTSREVAYTLCRLGNNAGTDSVVYLHDNDGRLAKTVSYLHSNTGAVDAPVAFQEYQVFSYDVNGNLMHWDDYKIQVGFETHCGSFLFDRYDARKNPLYSGDDVRAASITWGGMLSNSANNCTGTGNTSIVYDYREDGRPRSCIAKLNGKDSYELIFEYK
ncbi:MAG TPA: hypothetical protein PKM63_01555 [Panacibacter sp.]|nr:hypothetical protein [Panacibacter sp.]HNP42941.1 hypothetical protein [Panacibacter sp.]